MLGQVDCQVVNFLLVALTQNCPLRFYSNWLYCLILPFFINAWNWLSACTKQWLGTVQLYLMIIFHSWTRALRFALASTTIMQQAKRFHVCLLSSTNRMYTSNFDKPQCLKKKDDSGLSNLWEWCFSYWPGSCVKLEQSNLIPHQKIVIKRHMLLHNHLVFGELCQIDRIYILRYFSISEINK